MPVDPVCRMQVDEGTARARTEYEGKTYYFCSPGCKETFDADPARFIAQIKDEERRR